MLRCLAQGAFVQTRCLLEAAVSMVLDRSLQIGRHEVAPGSAERGCSMRPRPVGRRDGLIPRTREYPRAMISGSAREAWSLGGEPVARPKPVELDSGRQYIPRRSVQCSCEAQTHTFSDDEVGRLCGCCDALCGTVRSLGGGGSHFLVVCLDGRKRRHTTRPGPDRVSAGPQRSRKRPFDCGTSVRVGVHGAGCGDSPALLPVESLGEHRGNPCNLALHCRRAGDSFLLPGALSALGQETSRNGLSRSGAVKHGGLDAGQAEEPVVEHLLEDFQVAQKGRCRLVVAVDAGRVAVGLDERKTIRK